MEYAILWKWLKCTNTKLVIIFPSNCTFNTAKLSECIKSSNDHLALKAVMLC